MSVGKTLQTPGVGNRRTRASRSLVANSSDIEDDIVDYIPIRASRRVLKEVNIVAMGSSKKNAPTQSPLRTIKVDRESSLGSPSFDNSDYETPGTSISTTPAMSIRRDLKSTRKSALSTTTNASGSRKRSLLIIADSEDEIEDTELHESLDAQLARQMQEEEYNNAANKRRKFGFDDSNLIDSDSELSAVPSEITPAYEGKGKGKAKVVEASSSRNRLVRSGRKKKTTFTTDDLLGDEEESEGDIFKPEDDDYNFDSDSQAEEVIDLVSDSDDNEPLMSVSKRKGKGKAKAPAANPSKPRRKAKVLSLKERQAKKKEARERNARYAHIEDKMGAKTGDESRAC